MKNKWIIWGAIALAITGVLYLATRPADGGGEGIVTVDAAKTEELVAAGGVTIVDVRTPDEYRLGHLPGAVNVPIDQIESVAAPWDRDEPLLVYCATGARSSTAVQQLQSMGFATIYHFSQGLAAWQGDLDSEAGQPVAQDSGVKTNGMPVMYEFYTDW